MSLGASGAVFGLFAVAVLLKLKFSFQKLVGHLVGNSCHMLQYHGHDTQVVISQTGRSYRWICEYVDHLPVQVEGLVLGQFVVKQVLQVRAASSSSCVNAAIAC